jgi:outer membrane immunogenic protein
MRKFWIAGLLAAISTGAFAADLPTQKAPPAPPMIYAPAFTWTGFYLGVNGGFAYRAMSSSNFDNSGGDLIGGTAGYNYQIGQFVGGVEGDVNFTDTTQSGTFFNGVNKMSTGMMTTARVRLGLAMDRSLFYVTGGYAGVSTRASFIDNNGVFGAQNQWRNGGVIGGGVEYAFTNNITGKAEYLYAPMSSATYFSGTPYVENSGLSMSLARVGLNFKF